MSEFSLIQTYFDWPDAPGSVALGVGDDAALLTLTAHEQLVVSVDTLVSGVHFPEQTPAHAIGHKALAVNLSDLAAMGATPRWFTLALTLPQADDTWLSGFSTGLSALARRHGIHLVGGDTTRGPLSITIQVMGTLPAGEALLRSGARVDDLIFVTGTLGAAAAGLALIRQRLELPETVQAACLQALNYPTPRVEAGQHLRRLASSCMDLSDGLLGDIRHILTRSGTGASLQQQAIPAHPALTGLPRAEILRLALSGGDDYELLFTLPPERLPQLQELQAMVELPALTPIGIMTADTGHLILDFPLSALGQAWEHFQNESAK